jgi:sugar lactone lactonase YvrE
MSNKSIGKSSFTSSNDTEENAALAQLKRNAKNPPKPSSGKFWFISLVLILIASILIAKSPLFKLNLDKPIKANYIELGPKIAFEGKLAPNTLLASAKHLAYKNLQGPETIVFAQDGTLYTGLMNGQIVKVDLAGGVHKIVQIGQETNETLCNDFGPDLHSHKKCGRPLGLRLSQDSRYLYVADAYYGILKVDLATGSKQLLFSSWDPRLGLAQIKMTNDLDLDGDIIYFIDSSYEREVNEAVEEHVEAIPRGRLFSFNERTHEIEILLENLYFPNGLQLTPEKDALLINENSMARILKYYLSGEKKGTKVIFIQLPGFGDTLRLSDTQTSILVPLVAVRSSGNFPVLDLLGKYPLVRHLLGYVINLRQLLQYVPKYGLVLEYDLNGQLIKSWHDPSGKVIESAAGITLHEGKLYIGSFYVNYIGVADY